MSTFTVLDRLHRPAGTANAVDRWWRLGSVVAAALIVLIGWTLVISPQRGQTDDLRAQNASVRTANAALAARIADLAAANRHLASYRSAYAAARAALPSQNDVADLLRSMQVLGNASHTEVSALSAQPPVAVAAPVATPSAGASTTTSTTTSTAAVASGVESMTVTMTVTGSTGGLEMFLRQLQAGQPRALLITQITEGGAAASGTSSPAGGQTSLQLTMQAFVDPSAATPTAVTSGTAH